MGNSSNAATTKTCNLCGAKMTIQSYMGSDGHMWGCSNSLCGQLKKEAHSTDSTNTCTICGRRLCTGRLKDGSGQCNYPLVVQPDEDYPSQHKYLCYNGKQREDRCLDSVL